MKILMIHPHDLYSFSEPWTVRVVRIAGEFIKRGHTVKLVYFPLDSAHAGRKFVDNGIEIISLDRRAGAARLFKNITEITRLAGWCDIIHFQKCYYYVALPALIAGWLKSKPIHYDWDDWETKIFYYSNPREVIVGEFIDIFERLLPFAADTVSVSSKRLYDLCLKRGVAAQNIFSAPVGADLQQFRPDLNLSGIIRKNYNIHNQLVLYVGQLHGGQYAELFIKSAPQVIKSHPAATFMIVGNGYRLNELKALATRLGLDKHFIFTGSVAHDEIPYYMCEADVCVACFEENDITRSKSPLKVVEYLACGKAIVASRVGEVRNMVGGVGVLAEPGDAGSLASGITLLLKNKALKEEMGRRSRERAEKKYNWSITAENLLRAYGAAVKNQGRG